MTQAKGRRSATTLSEINVTPLVDVMLVLLIIFMVTAPMFQHGIDVELPKETAKEIDIKQTTVITLAEGEKIYLNDRLISIEKLADSMQKLSKLNSQKEVFLRADRKVPYGFVVKVIAAVKRAGVDRLGMVTEPTGK